MMYYAKAYSITGKNKLQSAIVEEVTKWNGTLLDGDVAKDTLLSEFHKNTERLNALFNQCRPCQMQVHSASLCFSTIGSGESFARLDLYVVKSIFDGIKRKEGGAR